MSFFPTVTNDLLYRMGLELDMKKVLNISADSDRLTCTITEGSVVIEFTMQPREDDSEPLASEVCCDPRAPKLQYYIDPRILELRYSTKFYFPTLFCSLVFAVSYMLFTIAFPCHSTNTKLALGQKYIIFSRHF